MLTPVDLQIRDFRKTFRGYDTRDVDEFLDRVTAEFERVFRANVQHRDEIDALKKRIEEYRQMEGNLRDTLMVAQDASQQLRAAAAKESDLILVEARDMARRIVEQAEGNTREKKAELAELRKTEEFFRIQFKALLQSYITALDAVSLDAQTPQSHSRPVGLTAVAGSGSAEAAATLESDSGGKVEHTTASF